MLGQNTSDAGNSGNDVAVPQRVKNVMELGLGRRRTDFAIVLLAYIGWKLRTDATSGAAGTFRRAATSTRLIEALTRI